MRYLKICVITASLAAMLGCATGRVQKARSTFGDDVAFLKNHTDVIVLSDSAGKALVAVSPQLQGRVVTSSANGNAGQSFGWINYELIASGQIQPHINVYGGEDRVWLGPEGGQFSIFFKKDSPFDLEHWFTPAPVDTEPFELLAQASDQVQLRKNIRLTNYSGTVFSLTVDRKIGLLERNEAVRMLGIHPAKSIKMVAYESVNKMTNTGPEEWKKETGLLSIWILGMFNPSPATTIVVPYKPGPEGSLGPIVNDTYFGKVPAERLVIKNNTIFFSGDGQYRSKIGLSPRRAKSVLGSYDATTGTLTIVQYNKPQGVTDYVNSMWQIQDAPYAGDVINSYNDGPPSPGAKPLGPFYELETSSPAAALQPGGTIRHIHRTYHFQGTEKDLDPVARATLGVSISQIKAALQR
jgi:hypothetical protein